LSTHDDEITTDHDFFDPAYVRRWAEQADRNNPDRTAIIEAFVTEVGAEVARLGRDVSVLELGPGAGRLAAELLRRTPISRYTLLDFSGPMLDLARENLGDDDRAAYVQADFRDSAWTDRIPERVDVVATMQAVHELRHTSRVRGLYQQLLRVLRPGGLLLLCDHLRPADDDRPLFLTEDEHIALLTDVGLTDLSVVHRSETKALLACHAPEV
jgi:SAM-dependent methyltransferase